MSENLPVPFYTVHSYFTDAAHPVTLSISVQSDC